MLKRQLCFELFRYLIKAGFYTTVVLSTCVILPDTMSFPPVELCCSLSIWFNAEDRGPRVKSEIRKSRMLARALSLQVCRGRSLTWEQLMLHLPVGSQLNMRMDFHFQKEMLFRISFAASYNAWRKFCGLSEPKSVKDFTVVLRNSHLAKDLFKLYGTPDNIEPWLGGISEPSVKDGRLGPLLACLAGQQFKNLRDGDRHLGK
ncbi:thyroid peroxidase-like [Mobula hypostoma]|uniref:thyroid peroxidase-like n=1 Tax=Mobula hypostoma TaxID=723540 RepID=UPI002FC34601